MRNSQSFRLVLVVAVLALVAAVVPMATTSSAVAADAPKVLGYVLLSSDQGTTCDLATVDWATGAVTDLPAATSAAACAHDLAVSPSGVVYGLATAVIAPDSVSSLSPAAATPYGLVTYASDGTPTVTPLTTTSTYSSTTTIPGGIAVNSSGTIFVLLNGLYANVVTCAPAFVPPSVADFDPSDSGNNFIPCLFTVDPSNGALTLVGSARLIGIASILSIGSDAMRTNSNVLQADVVWSTIDPALGTLTDSVTVALPPYSGFDALRSGSTVYSLDFADGGSAVYTATVDPSTGVVTRIATMSSTKVQYGSLAVTIAPEPPTTTTTSTTTTTVPEEVVVPKVTG